MLTPLFFLMALIHLISSFFILRLLGRNRKSYTLIAAATIVALTYENSVVALGSFIGEGTFLELLNTGRFYLHALLMSLLIIFAFGVARQIGIRWAQGKIAHALFCILATVLVLFAIQRDIINLSLVAEIEQDTLRYVNADSAGPPIPAILTIIVMAIIGGFVWRKIGWPWLAVGSIIMFVAAGAGASILALSNLGEVIFVIAIVATDYRIHRQLQDEPDESTSALADFEPAITH